MVRWLAPILSFTAEEAYGHLPGASRKDSVFHECWHEFPPVTQDDGIDWDAILRLKTDVQQELERLRNAGAIGAPLDATIEVWCDAKEYPRFSRLGDELRFALISSQARVTEVVVPPDGASPAPTAAPGGVWLSVQPNDDAKCVRCWQRRRDVGSDPAHPELCARCSTNVAGAGESRTYA
jgi:isoleucyl-tRNA synthetase